MGMAYYCNVCGASFPAGHDFKRNVDVGALEARIRELECVIRIIRGDVLCGYHQGDRPWQYKILADGVLMQTGEESARPQLGSSLPPIDRKERYRLAAELLQMWAKEPGDHDAKIIALLECAEPESAE